jgi:hypothetical protein
MFSRLNKLYHGFPQKFWIIILTFFIDSIGGILCAVSALGFFALHLRLGGQKRFAPASPADDQPASA